MNTRKALAANLETAKSAVDELEAKWTESKATLADADASPNAKESAIDDAKDAIQSAERPFKNLPADDEQVKALRARVDAVSEAIGASASAEQVTEVLETIKRKAELYENEFDGWQQEADSPSWAEFSKESSEKMSRLGRPKTVDYVSRIGDALESLEEDDSYQTVKGNAQVKAAVAALRADYDKARASLVANANKLADGASAAGVTSDNESKVSSLRDNIRYTLDEDSEEAKPLIAKLERAVADHETAGVAAEGAKAEAYKTMTADATAKWPAMLAAYETVDGFDPANAAASTGKLIKIETDNLMGYRFKPNDFPFATTLNGQPVAARYDLKVKAEIDRVEAALGRSLGDSDDDGRWTFIARVEGTSGKLLQKIEHEADVTVDGSKVGTVLGTETRPVDAPIVTIVAAHCGPLAVSAN